MAIVADSSRSRSCSLNVGHLEPVGGLGRQCRDRSRVCRRSAASTSDISPSYAIVDTLLDLVTVGTGHKDTDLIPFQPDCSRGDRGRLNIERNRHWVWLWRTRNGRIGLIVNKLVEPPTAITDQRKADTINTAGLESATAKIGLESA